MQMLFVDEGAAQIFVTTWDPIIDQNILWSWSFILSFIDAIYFVSFLESSFWNFSEFFQSWVD